MTQRRRPLFEDKQHLVRMAGIFAVGIAIFLGLQLLLVPDTFGLYGHYRAAAIGEEMRKPRTFAGRAVCANCHGPQVEVHKSGKHAMLGCEACHGALLGHAANPRNVKVAKPSAKLLCPTCHEKNIARPKWLKQVDAPEHSGGERCDSCHQPHSPAI